MWTVWTHSQLVHLVSVGTALAQHLVMCMNLLNKVSEISHNSYGHNDSTINTDIGTNATIK